MGIKTVLAVLEMMVTRLLTGCLKIQARKYSVYVGSEENYSVAKYQWEGLMGT